jgi:hypothetical protein
MPFVKLDTGILNSTLWIDHDAREIFITALLMAEPLETTGHMAQIAIDKIEHTGWYAPPGWYGFVPAASVGIIRRAGVDQDKGLAAIARLGEPDQESRTPDHEGRRMIRIDGGFLILNYFKYRDRDYSSAERSRRYRERQKNKTSRVSSTQTRVAHDENMPRTRDITQAEAEAEEYKSEKRAPVDNSVPRETEMSDATKTCIMLRLSGHNIANTGHPGLLAALKAGATPESIRDVANEFPDKPLAYWLNTVLGRIRDASKLKVPPKANTDALMAWNKLIASGGAYRSPQALVALERIGGWMAVRQRTTYDEPKLKAAFCAAYAETPTT